MNITLNSIKEAQSKIAEMIAAYETQFAKTEITLPSAQLVLLPGERYSGLILSDYGEPRYHLILLPGEAGGINWQDAREWAIKKGGDLPTRREQPLLYANLKSEFQEAWYWSDQEHESNSGWAWCQHFGCGTQSYGGKHDELRARAVRRVSIK